MAHQVPTTEPATLVAGDTATWTKSLSDYPASAGWVLSYTLLHPSYAITIAATASGDDHLVSVAPVVTAAWAAGDYQWVSRVSLAGAVHSVATGNVTITANPAAAPAGRDMRSHARKTLAAIEAWIEGRDMGVAEYEIAGRRLKTIPTEQLLTLRDRYRRDVRAEDDATRAAAGLPSRNKVLVRFGRPT